jgi:DNA-binding transcriptional LysR family regulator
MAAAAAIAGVGIAQVLSYQVDGPVANSQLSLVLEAYEPAAMPLSFVYPSQRQVPLKLRAFLDFATPRLRERMSYGAA